MSLINEQRQNINSIEFYPFAYALYNENLTTYCWYCLDDANALKRCSGCATALFCNKECQTLAWKDHKFECKALKTTKLIPNIEVRLLGRIVIRYKAILNGKDKEDLNFYKDRTSCRSIMDIWAHTKRISSDNYAMNKFNKIYDELINFYDSKALLDRDVIFQLHCRDFINRHAISDKAYIKEIGKGLYLDMCAYDHSCKPNSIYICKGFKASLRALNLDVNLKDCSTTFYSYIDLFCLKQERQKLLRDTWYFKCECDRCIDNYENILVSINCSYCTVEPQQRICIFGKQEYKDPETLLFTCPKCSTTIKREKVVEAIELMRFIDEVLENSNLKEMSTENAIIFLNSLINQSLTILPKVNIYYCKIIQALIPFIDPFDNKKLLELHLIVEECIRICYPYNHPALGFHLRNIGIFAFRLKDSEKAIKYLTEALSIFEFVMDSDHCLVETTKTFLNDALKQQSKLANKMNKLNLVNETEQIENNIQIENNFQSKPSKKILIRCEVFAESFDKDDLTIKTPTVYSIDEETKKLSINNHSINTNQSKNDCFKKVNEEEEEESEVKFIKKNRRFIFKVKNSSSDNFVELNQINNLENEKNSNNLLKMKKNVMQIANLNEEQFDKKLFVNTRSDPEANSYKIRVKKKAALKKISPRSRTPIPFFSNFNKNLDSIQSGNNFLNIEQCENYLNNNKPNDSDESSEIDEYSKPFHKITTKILSTSYTILKNDEIVIEKNESLNQLSNKNLITN